MLQDLRGYPESIIGLLLAARGFGAFMGNFLVLIISKRDPRIGLALGFIAQASSCWLLANFDINMTTAGVAWASACLLYTSPSPRDKRQSRMPSSA